jgi:hypothetical protein
LGIVVNALEVLLKQAATEPEYRAAFYEALLAGTIYVIGQKDAPAGAQHLSAGSQVQIEHWEKEDGSQVIPFFSSLEALQRGMADEVKYLSMTGRALFEIVAQGDLPLVLNPNADYGKEFYLAEVQALLTHGVNKLPQTRVVEKETKVMLGLPARRPEKLIKAVAAFLASCPSVEAAYIASIHDPGTDEKPHLLLGIQADGEAAALEPLIGAAGQIASDLLPDGDYLDMVRVVPGEHGLSEYFLGRIAPFYQRGMPPDSTVN